MLPLILQFFLWFDIVKDMLYNMRYVNTYHSLNPGYTGYGGTNSGVNPWTTMVGNLLSRTRQLTSEAHMKRKECIVYEEKY